MNFTINNNNKLKSEWISCCIQLCINTAAEMGSSICSCFLSCWRLWIDGIKTRDLVLNRTVHLFLFLFVISHLFLIFLMLLLLPCCCPPRIRKSCSGQRMEIFFGKRLLKLRRKQKDTFRLLTPVDTKGMGLGNLSINFVLPSCRAMLDIYSEGRLDEFSGIWLWHLSDLGLPKDCVTDLTDTMLPMPVELHRLWKCKT